MKNTVIYISSRGRPEERSTLRSLPVEALKHTRLVVREDEEDLYLAAGSGARGKLLVLPRGVEGLSSTRQWLTENAPARYVIHLDDDLRWSVRRKGAKLDKATPADVALALGAIIETLRRTCMTGISLRTGNNRVTDDLVFNTRIGAAYGVDARLLNRYDIRFDRVPLKQDIDVNLQLLRSGHKTACWFKWAVDQTSQRAGGCASYRTLELLSSTAKHLAALHPGFVRLVTKNTWRGLGERTEVVVSWKKAFLSSQP